MNYRPDESILISYLYGELNAGEGEKVKKYLQEHPEEQKHMDQLAEVLGIISKVKDKEVIAPPIFADEKPRSIWFSGYVKTITSIAASLLILMTVGRLLGTEVNYSQGELRISFDKRQNNSERLQSPQSLSLQQVQEMINASLAKNNEAVTASINDHQKKLEQSLKQNMIANSRKIDELVNNASAASREQLSAFVATLQSENLKTVQQYLQLSAADQNKYVEGLLVDFSKYLQEQRNQDLQFFQTRMTNIEKNTDEFKQETEQILASIINNNDVKKQSSY